jgi:glycine cleavage system H protein
MTMNLPPELLYTESHEWIRREPDGTLSIGITEFAQSALGDLVYVQLPEVGTEVKEGDSFAVVESVKAASDIYAPFAGRIVAINEGLKDRPESINRDAFGSWIVRISPGSPQAANALLDAAAYEKVVASRS